ncbi:hypothetical protein F5Y19DRAFT_451970 [Xylariaceae sp. FL1651]|nr:hypothetical protein F5Y19DRAFT_451970 [Xylariaceae sp. FL1651]
MSKKLRLLEMSPGSVEGAIELNHILLELSAASYIACAVFTNSCDPASALSTEQSSLHISAVLPPPLQDMLHRLRDKELPIRLWIDQLCIPTTPAGEQMDYQCTTALRDIYAAAKETIIWAGGDHDDSDGGCFDALLGPGNYHTTEHAFNFASRLAGANVSDIAKLFDERYSADMNKHSWAYLFRILCRPFFRGLPLLRTNYASELPHATVQCGNARISLLTLRQAAHRIRAVFPVPRFLRNLDKSLLDENKESLTMDIDRSFLLTSIRFGLDSFTILARVESALTSVGDTEGPKESNSRFLVHLGYCDDIYDFEGSEALFRLPSVETRELESDPTTFIEKAIARSHITTPSSLPFEGYMHCPPRPEDQAPFVHHTVNRRTKISLVRLLPAGSVIEPLQCGLIDAPVNELPEFQFVTNSTFIRKTLQAKDFHGVQFPVTTRSTVPILVNGQAFVIPKLQEVFLRLIRHSSQPVHLFLWNICMYPQESALETRANVEDYIAVKHFMKSERNANETDMYAVLDRAARERGRHQLKELGLPETLLWDDWLLELND